MVLLPFKLKMRIDKKVLVVFTPSYQEKKEEITQCIELS